MLRFLLILLLCLPARSQAQYSATADAQASAPLRKLSQRLQTLLPRGVMFGHQDDMAYGVGWKYIHGRSDVKDVCGDWPAVYGWDLGHLELGRSHNLDSVPFDSIRAYIRWVHAQGGINTISWHGNNPASGGSAWDTTLAVAAILPGGGAYNTYITWLDRLADFMHSLTTADGSPIPVIFRPFHEHTGSWFWWGQRQCTTTEFRTLWQFTFNYLCTQKQVHNLLYAYSAADFRDETDYLERYPGDAFVDVIGFDQYQYRNAEDYQRLLRQRLQVLERVAATHHKIPALTETGLERIPQPTWWTETLLPVLRNYPVSYVLLWRNGRPDHYYAPYPEQASAANFRQFYADERTLFLEEVKNKK